MGGKLPNGRRVWHLGPGKSEEFSILFGASIGTVTSVRKKWYRKKYWYRYRTHRWPKFFLMQVAPYGGQISNKCMWHHLLTKFASCKVPPVMVSTHGSVVPLTMFIINSRVFSILCNFYLEHGWASLHVSNGLFRAPPAHCWFKWRISRSNLPICRNHSSFQAS